MLIDFYNINYSKHLIYVIKYNSTCKCDQSFWQIERDQGPSRFAHFSCSHASKYNVEMKVNHQAVRRPLPVCGHKTKCNLFRPYLDLVQVLIITNLLIKTTDMYSLQEVLTNAAPERAEAAKVMARRRLRNLYLEKRIKKSVTYVGI